jgi:putative acetyltransferase
MPADAEAVAAVLAASFDDESDAILEVVHRLRTAGDLVLELVAEHGGAVVGYVALSRAWLDARERLVDVLVLSPIGVRPDSQGMGIGTALLAAAVEAARSTGVPLVFLEGAPGFYSARGWERASAHGLDRPSVRIPDAACQVVLFESHEPWMTGRLVYPDVWWRLDLVGLRDPVLGQVENA